MNYTETMKHRKWGKKLLTTHQNEFETEKRFSPSICNITKNQAKTKPLANRVKSEYSKTAKNFLFVTLFTK